MFIVLALTILTIHLTGNGFKKYESDTTYNNVENFSCNKIISQYSEKSEFELIFNSTKISHVDSFKYENGNLTIHKEYEKRTNVCNTVFYLFVINAIIFISSLIIYKLTEKVDD